MTGSRGSPPIAALKAEGRTANDQWFERALRWLVPLRFFEETNYCTLRNRFPWLNARSPLSPDLTNCLHPKIELTNDGTIQAYYPLSS